MVSLALFSKLQRALFSIGLENRSNLVNRLYTIIATRGEKQHAAAIIYSTAAWGILLYNVLYYVHSIAHTNPYGRHTTSHRKAAVG